MPDGSTSAAPAAIDPSRPVTIIIIGAGQRGQAYASYALSHPAECAVVAVAEPRPITRGLFAKKHQLDKTLVFDDWRALLSAVHDTAAALEGARLADAVVVAVQDALHADVVRAFAPLGYAILCEKPLATSVRDCLAIHKAVTDANIVFGIGHGPRLRAARAPRRAHAPRQCSATARTRTSFSRSSSPARSARSSTSRTSSPSASSTSRTRTSAARGRARPRAASRS
jgi:pimeloyl-ACP methyl ester carboxylesterase